MPERPVVSKRSGGRRARARKRRPAASSGPPQPPPQRKQRAARVAPAGQRPQAPWHPWPLSELLILVGVVGVILAWRGGIASHAALIAAGLAAIAIGTMEVTLREHLAGFRSHTVLLAIVPPIVVHSATILALAGFMRVPRWVNLPLLALDIALFAVLYKYLRGRYLDARRERAFAGAR
jgi:hypothetical protein